MRERRPVRRSIDPLGDPEHQHQRAAQSPAARDQYHRADEKRIAHRPEEAPGRPELIEDGWRSAEVQHDAIAKPDAKRSRHERQAEEHEGKSRMSAQDVKNGRRRKQNDQQQSSEQPGAEPVVPFPAPHTSRVDFPQLNRPKPGARWPDGRQQVQGIEPISALAAGAEIAEPPERTSHSGCRGRNGKACSHPTTAAPQQKRQWRRAEECQHHQRQVGMDKKSRNRKDRRRYGDVHGWRAHESQIHTKTEQQHEVPHQGCVAVARKPSRHRSGCEPDADGGQQAAFTSLSQAPDRRQRLCDHNHGVPDADTVKPRW